MRTPRSYRSAKRTRSNSRRKRSARPKSYRGDGADPSTSTDTFDTAEPPTTDTLEVIQLDQLERMIQQDVDDDMDPVVVRFIPAIGVHPFGTLEVANFPPVLLHLSDSATMKRLNDMLTNNFKQYEYELNTVPMQDRTYNSITIKMRKGSEPISTPGHRRIIITDYAKFFTEFQKLTSIGTGMVAYANDECESYTVPHSWRPGLPLSRSRILG